MKKPRERKLKKWQKNLIEHVPPQTLAEIIGSMVPDEFKNNERV